MYLSAEELEALLAVAADIKKSKHLTHQAHGPAYFDSHLLRQGKDNCFTSKTNTSKKKAKTIIFSHPLINEHPPTSEELALISALFREGYVIYLWQGPNTPLTQCKPCQNSDEFWRNRGNCIADTEERVRFGLSNQGISAHDYIVFDAVKYSFIRNELIDSETLLQASNSAEGNKHSDIVLNFNQINVTNSNTLTTLEQSIPVKKVKAIKIEPTNNTKQLESLYGAQDASKHALSYQCDVAQLVSKYPEATSIKLQNVTHESCENWLRDILDYLNSTSNAENIKPEIIFPIDIHDSYKINFPNNCRFKEITITGGYQEENNLQHQSPPRITCAKYIFTGLKGDYCNLPIERLTLNNVWFDPKEGVRLPVNLKSLKLSACQYLDDLILPPNLEEIELGGIRSDDLPTTFLKNNEEQLKKIKRFKLKNIALNNDLLNILTSDNLEEITLEHCTDISPDALLKCYKKGVKVIAKITRLQRGIDILGFNPTSLEINYYNIGLIPSRKLLPTVNHLKLDGRTKERTKGENSIFEQQLLPFSVDQLSLKNFSSASFNMEEIKSTSLDLYDISNLQIQGKNDKIENINIRKVTFNPPTDFDLTLYPNLKKFRASEEFNGINTIKFSSQLESLIIETSSHQLKEIFIPPMPKLRTLDPEV